MLFSTKDVTEQEMQEAESGGLVPVGRRRFAVESARHAQNKTETGEFIEVVLIPEGLTRKVWLYFNFKHTNPTAEKMGRVELKKFLDALEIVNLTDVEVLRGKTLFATVSHQKDKRGEMREKLSSYEKDADLAF